MIDHLDFAENYSFVINEEVQGYHWTNSQMTIHPFYCQWADDTGKISSRTITILSDTLEHNANTIERFRRKFLEKIKAIHPNISKIYWVSDGTGAQYKNKNSFINVMQYKALYNIESEMHFTVSYHGKSECDAASAVIKRSLRSASIRDKKSYWMLGLLLNTVN